MARRTGGQSITGGPTTLNLGDLRWLLEQAKDLPDSATLILYVDKGFDQRDAGSSSLTLPTGSVQ